MEFKKQFKEAHPETIGETDSHFDKSNYIDWIDKEYAQLQADKAELLEALYFAKRHCKKHAPVLFDKIESLIQKHKQ